MKVALVYNHESANVINLFGLPNREKIAQNSLQSIESEKGSYAKAAEPVGIGYAGLVNRLVEVASARYFGTPQPVAVDLKSADVSELAISFITQRRDRLERRLKEWTELSSRTSDPVGLQQASHRAGAIFEDLGLTAVPEFTDDPEVWTWQTAKGFEGGTLFVGHLDVPVEVDMPHQAFRRDPEWLYGAGVGTSRAPLVMLEYAFRALRSVRKLHRGPLGVLLYGDEGQDARHGAAMIRKAAAKARQVFVLRPGAPGSGAITAGHGYRKYRLSVVGEPERIGRIGHKRTPALWWTCRKIGELTQLSSQNERVSISALDLSSERRPIHMPHRTAVTVVMTYPDASVADAYGEKMRSVLGKTGPKWELIQVSDRPPMKDRVINKRLMKALSRIAEEHQIPLKSESSRWPSVAGLVPSRTACICGVAPVTRDRGTPQEAVQRISLIQRTLLMTDFLVKLS